LPSAEQLYAEAERLDRTAQLHGEQIKVWEEAMERQRKAGNLQLVSEYARMILKAMEFEDEALSQAKRCRAEAKRIEASELPLAIKAA
jgi:hypothetical protein